MRVGFAEELASLLGDEGDVGLEGRGCQSILDELFSMSVSHSIILSSIGIAYLLLLHQLRIGTIIDDILAKHRRCER